MAEEESKTDRLSAVKLTEAFWKENGIVPIIQSSTNQTQDGTLLIRPVLHIVYTDEVKQGQQLQGQSQKKNVLLN